MRLYAPKYYKNFKCIAGACEHSCCIGWEIDVDEAALEKYKSLKSGYGATVMDTISLDETPHFLLGNGERCPHLDEHGLCRIITNLGEGYLCDICREHPRFYNFTDVCEVGIGMSCPEAARVILSSPDYISFEEIGEIDADSDEIEFDAIGEREKIYKILSDTSLAYGDRLEKIYSEYQITVGSDREYLEILNSLEYLNEEHKSMFLCYSSNFRPEKNELVTYLERFLAYFIYRHVTEGEDFEDFCARLGFCLFCERLFASLICQENAKTLEDVSKLAVIISEEIEYSSDNTWALTYKN